MKKILLLICIISSCARKNNAVVFQTDFGVKDGAVNAMKGVAYSVDPQLQLFDLSHEIPAYDTWQAAYRLYQAAAYWPPGTVFVSVVDPGVGTARRSVVMKTKTGHYFVAPDNGTLTLVSDALKIKEVREIDERINRRNNSDSSYTFHGRDVYAYTAARLAAGKISFEETGPVYTSALVRLEYQQPVFYNNTIMGNIPVLDVQYGNVWTNISDSLFKKLAISYNSKIDVTILHKDSIVFNGSIKYVKTFGGVDVNQPLCYINSLMNFSLAVNQGNFADSFHVKSGKDWNIRIQKAVQ